MSAEKPGLSEAVEAAARVCSKANAEQWEAGRERFIERHRPSVAAAYPIIRAAVLAEVEAHFVQVAAAWCVDWERCGHQGCGIKRAAVLYVRSLAGDAP